MEIPLSVWEFPFFEKLIVRNLFAVFYYQFGFIISSQEKEKSIRIPVQLATNHFNTFAKWNNLETHVIFIFSCWFKYLI